MRRWWATRDGRRTPWMLLFVAVGVLLLMLLFALAVIGVLWVVAYIVSGNWVPHPG